MLFRDILTGKRLVAGESLHVDEGLEADIKVLAGDLFPEIIQFLLADPAAADVPPPRQRIEELDGKLIRSI